MFESESDHASTEAHAVALDCLRAGIEAAHPAAVVADCVSYDTDTGRLCVGSATYDLTDVSSVDIVGGGNAAGAIAAALEEVLQDRLDEGVVVTDNPRETDIVETLPGDHPTPSDRSVESTAAVRDLAADAGPDSLVLAIVAGGGSALLTAPVADVTLAQVRDLTDALVESGAPIGDINTVRKHVSAVKGGRLARTAAPAAVVGIVFSDVVGDDPAVVASGPTAPDPTTYADAVRVLDRYDIHAPAAVREHLTAGSEGDRRESPGPGAQAFDTVDNHVLASGSTAVQAAAEQATHRGYTPVVLSTQMRGEATEIARAHAAIAEEVQQTGNPADPPAVLISGGETTVTVDGDGMGGPNQEFAVSGALELPSGPVLGSVDTDGRDGSTDAAGALVDSDTITDHESARDALAENDAYTCLDACDALLFTGDTGTNVNDLRVVIVDG
jgi:hydroxypyruvate reductase